MNHASDPNETWRNQRQWQAGENHASYNRFYYQSPPCYYSDAPSSSDLSNSASNSPGENYFNVEPRPNLLPTENVSSFSPQLSNLSMPYNSLSISSISQADLSCTPPISNQLDQLPLATRYSVPMDKSYATLSIETYQGDICNPELTSEFSSPHTTPGSTSHHGSYTSPYSNEPVWSHADMYTESRDIHETSSTHSANFMSGWPFHPAPSGDPHNVFNSPGQPGSAIEHDPMVQFSNHNEPPSTMLATYNQKIMDDPSSSPLTCPYCHYPDTIFQDTNTWHVHIWANHPTQAIWQSRTCIWAGCLCEKVFSTYKGWLEHVHSVHWKRYECRFNGCTVGKRFGSANMVLRHYHTTHCKPVLCTKTGCPGRKDSNLYRKDKRKEHDAKWHGPFVCEVHGCPRGRIQGQNHGFSQQVDLDLHIKKKHRYLSFRNGKT